MFPTRQPNVMILFSRGLACMLKAESLNTLVKIKKKEKKEQEVRNRKN